VFEQQLKRKQRKRLSLCLFAVVLMKMKRNASRQTKATNCRKPHKRHGDRERESRREVTAGAEGWNDKKFNLPNVEQQTMDNKRRANRLAKQSEFRVTRLGELDLI
jgi:Ni/Co efflux regulator RcnB